MPAPASGDLVRWPDAFGTRFTILVDTEEEFDWAAPLSRTARGTTAVAALPAAHRRLSEAGAALVYLVDHPVATEPAAIAAVREVLAEARAAGGAGVRLWDSRSHEGARHARGNPPETLRVSAPRGGGPRRRGRA